MTTHRYLKPKTIQWMKSKGVLNEAESAELIADVEAYRQENERLLEFNELFRTAHILDKMIERSDRYIRDAVSRDDYNDVAHFEGQKKAFQESKALLIGKLRDASLIREGESQ